jgi:hypothetical protein
MKLCSLTVFFVYKVPRDVMVKFRRNPDLCQKIKYVQISPIQQTGHFLVAITRNALAVWSHKINHQKAERIT